MRKSHLRRTLGRIKQRLVDEWPYFYLKEKASRIACTARDVVSDLPKIACDDASAIEVHVLCGEKQADMGMWATWSLLRFLDPAQLWVHSDGSLSDRSLERWNKVTCGLKVVQPSDVNRAWGERGLDCLPNLNEFRHGSHCAQQVTDFHLFGHSAKILMMDTDVLCFKRPEHLIRLLETPERVFAYNLDFENSYCAEPDEIKRLIGIAFPERLNAGFMVLSRFALEDYRILEGYIERLRSNGLYNSSHTYATQTAYGIAAALSGVAKPLPNTYSVILGRKPSSTIIRHYVGPPSIRPRFYTEGVTELLVNSLRPEQPTKVQG